MNYLRTVSWIGFAVAATYTACEWAVSHRETLAEDRLVVSQPLDVEAAYKAVLQKHVAKHPETNRLNVELQRLERQQQIVREIQATQAR